MNDKPQFIKPVPPFVKFVCANVPMVFDDSLSYYEALCAMWKYLDNVVNVVNNNATITEEEMAKFKELKDYVDHYFDTLDLQEEVNAKLDAMVLDGTLGALINQVLFESKMNAYKPLVADVKLEYSGRSGKNQAFCHTVDGKFVVITIGEDDTTNVISEYNHEGTLLRSAYITCYHPNSCCYVDGYVYIANAYQTVGGVTSDINVVTKVDYSDFTTTEINLSHPVKVIGYYDGKFYCLSDAYDTLKIYNSDFTNLIATETIPNYGDLYQGMVIDEHHIILPQSYSWVVWLNREDYTLDRIINIRNFDYITCGELQDIDFYDDKLWLNCSRSLGGDRSYWYIGSFNPTVGNVNKEMLRHVNNPYSNKQLYVNASVTSVKQLGTSDNPFCDIEQAVMALFNPFLLGVKISIANGTYGKVHLENFGKPITIISSGSKSSTFIHGFNINACNNVYLENFTVDQVYNADTNNYGLYAQNSNVTLKNVKFDVDNSIYFDDGELHQKTSVSVTDSNAMSVTNATYINNDADLKNFVKKKTVIYNRPVTIYSSDSGTDITGTISFTGYNLNDFKTLKINLDISTAATTTVWHKPIFVDVSSSKKYDILLKDSGQNINWWCVLTLSMNLSTNKISGSSQWTTTITGEGIGSGNQPVLKVMSIEEVR